MESTAKIRELKEKINELQILMEDFINLQPRIISERNQSSGEKNE